MSAQDRICNHYSNVLRKDKKLRSLYSEILDSKNIPNYLKIGCLLNKRIDDIRCFTGWSRYDFRYFSSDFFQEKKLRQPYFNRLKEEIKRRLSTNN